MPEAERTPPIELRLMVRGKRKTERIIALLREHGVEAEIVEADDDELVDYFQTDLHRQIEAETTDGDRLKIRRDNAGLTQTQLAAKTGITRQRISDMECGRRAISIAAARKLAEALGVAAAQIIKV